MATLFLLLALAAPDPRRPGRPSTVGLYVLPRPADLPAPVVIHPELDITPVGSLTGTEFPVLDEAPNRVLLRHRGRDVWVHRAEVLTPREAIEIYSELIREKPNPQHLVRRAKAHELNLDWDAAIRDYDELLRLSPETSAYHNNRANYFSRKGDYDKALAGYDEALRLAPGSPIPMNNKAMVYAHLRAWNAAVQLYDQALKMNPGYARAYAGRSSAYREQRDYARALADAEKAVQLEPQSPHSFLARGLVRLAMKDVDGADADFAETLQLDPLFAPGYYGRAGVHLARKAYQPAIRDLDTALRLLPRYPAALVRRAEAWNECGNPRRAVQDLDEALAMDPRYVPACRLKAWLLATHPEAKIRDGQEALRLARKALELEKQPGGDVWETLAAALAENSDFPAAVREQTKALQDQAYVRDMGEVVSQRLKVYQAGRPFRSPSR